MSEGWKCIGNPCWERIFLLGTHWEQGEKPQKTTPPPLSGPFVVCMVRLLIGYMKHFWPGLMAGAQKVWDYSVVDAN
jgi:hypothetical protein